MRTTKWLAAGAVSMMTIGALASSARADLKLEQTVTTTGGMEPGAANTKTKPVSSSSTLYYKGIKSRLDDANTIIIFDAETGKTITIDPKKKTYYESMLSDMAAAGDLGGMANMVDFTSDVTVTDTKEEKPILGKTAHHYKYTVTMKMVLKDPSAPAAMASFLPSIEIVSDQWTVPSPDAATAMKINTTGMIKRMPMGMGKALKPLVEKMAAIKGLPVEQVQTFRYIISPTAPEELKAQAPKEPLVSTTKTVTMSEAALADSLFAIPVGYKKIDAPIITAPGG